MAEMLHQNTVLMRKDHAHQLKDSYKMNFYSFELISPQMGASY